LSDLAIFTERRSKQPEITKSQITKSLNAGRVYEGTSVGKEDLRQVQGHPPQRRGAGDLRKLETQTTPGLAGFGP
jgi:hypothetical protein